MRLTLWKVNNLKQQKINRLLLSLLLMWPLLSLAEQDSHYVNLSKRQVDKLTGGICSTDKVLDCGGHEAIDDGIKVKEWWIKYQPKVLTANTCIQMKSNYILSDDYYQQFSELFMGERQDSGQCGHMLIYYLNRSRGPVYISTKIVEDLSYKASSITALIQNNHVISTCPLLKNKKDNTMYVDYVGISTEKKGPYLYDIGVGMAQDERLYSLYFDPKTGVEVCDKDKYLTSQQSD